MNSKVETRTQFVVNECKGRGVFDLEVEYCTDKQEGLEDLDYAVITNSKGDLATIGASGATLEAALYTPKWSKGVRNWAKAEGFSRHQIKEQDLIKNATLKEIIRFFSTPSILPV